MRVFGNPTKSIVNEYGLYNLILGSRKPEAKNFKRWITHEVIPAIRQTGGYIVGEENMTDDELIAKAFTVLNKKLEQAQTKLKEQEPKVYFSNIVNDSKGLILIRDLAKLVSNSGYLIGEKKLFQYLRNNGYLISKYGADYNSPTQKSIQLGLLQLKEKSFTDCYGHEQLSKTTYVTGKGQQYFIRKFKNINEQQQLIACPFN